MLGGMKYFAYGSNMDVAQMKERCPDAELLDVAVLHGTSFRINRYGVATVIPSAAKVYGVLWGISANDATNLSVYEGEKDEFYFKEVVSVQPAKIQPLTATIYLAANIQPGKPRSGYLELILRAAKAHGFPNDYMTEIASWREFRPSKAVIH